MIQKFIQVQVKKKKKEKVYLKKHLSPSLVPSRLETFITFKYFKRKKMDIPE